MTNVTAVRATPAGVYDYLLGGASHQEADRIAADRLLAIEPDAIDAARRNRDFICRAASWAVSQGVHQVVDAGCGPPGPVGMRVHETIHEADSSAVVAYLDHDPAVIESMGSCVAAIPTVHTVAADLREPEAAMRLAAERGGIDCASPLVVILGSVLHQFRARVAAAIVAGFAGSMPAGSYLILSVGTAGKERAAELRAAYTASPAFQHQPDEVSGWLESSALELLAPGLCEASQWRPEPLAMPLPSDAYMLCAVARKA